MRDHAADVDERGDHVRERLVEPPETEAEFVLDLRGVAGAARRGAARRGGCVKARVAATCLASQTIVPVWLWRQTGALAQAAQG
eukprot:SAG11_NODE_15072_length_590_cov_0.839104_1_plen_84_part_00